MTLYQLGHTTGSVEASSIGRRTLMPLLPNIKPKKLTRTHQKAGRQPGMRHLGQESIRQSASSMRNPASI